MPSNFPDPEKVCKIEIKSGKMVKRLEFFFLKATSAPEVFFVCFSQILFNFGGRFGVHQGKRFVPAFSRSIDHLMDNFESGKRNTCFGKKSAKSLGSKNLYERYHPII